MRKSTFHLSLLLGMLALFGGLLFGNVRSSTAQGSGEEGADPTALKPSRLLLPISYSQPISCTMPGTSYGTLSVRGEAFNAENHPDLNLAMRGYVTTNQPRNLVDYGGDTDFQAPQLYSLFADNRTPAFRTVYQVYQWDWECNCKGGLIGFPPVTMAGLASTPGEAIRVPDRVRGDIGEGYKVLVLYATETRITLKYTREDNVIYGYTVHLENICVDPNLVTLYRTLHREGRHALPALFGGQALGRARGSEVQVVIRDVGSFMDPRSRKDWWQGR